MAVPVGQDATHVPHPCGITGARGSCGASSPCHRRWGDNLFRLVIKGTNRTGSVRLVPRSCTVWLMAARHARLLLPPPPPCPPRKAQRQGGVIDRTASDRRW